MKLFWKIAMKRRNMEVVICGIAALILFALPHAVSGKNRTDSLTMVVGTYNDGASKGIRTYGFNQENGKISKMKSLVPIDNPSYLAISSDGRHIYAVSEMDDSTAALNDLDFDIRSGMMKLANSFLTKGSDPCYVSENGKTAIVANYGGGSMTVFPISEDGSLQQADTVIEGGIGGPDASRQGKAHVHCTCFSPDGKFVFISDFSSDSLLRFTISESNGGILCKSDNGNADHGLEAGTGPGLTGRKGFAVGNDFGPRHIIFDKKGRNLYVIGELSGAIDVFSYRNGEIHLKQSILAEEAKARGAADIHISPDGKFLYASCRLKNDGIAIFKIDRTTGTLAKTGYRTTGKHPRNFAITPNGKFLLVACRDDNEIQVFKRNPHTGSLTRTKTVLSLKKPVCIKFADAKSYLSK